MTENQFVHHCNKSELEEFLNSKSTDSINSFIRSEDKSLNNSCNETVKLTYIFLILLKINFSMQMANFSLKFQLKCYIIYKGIRVILWEN